MFDVNTPLVEISKCYWGWRVILNKVLPAYLPMHTCIADVPKYCLCIFQRQELVAVVNGQMLSLCVV